MYTRYFNNVLLGFHERGWGQLYVKEGRLNFDEYVTFTIFSTNVK